jgi:hypothetical protein
LTEQTTIRHAASHAHQATGLGATAEDAKLLRAFEIPPVNLDLLGADERDAAIAATRELYNAIPGPFQILSVPIERSASEHLNGLSPAPGAPRRYLTAYAGLYRDLAANLARQPRRSLIVLQASSEAAVARIAELVRRTAEEHGIWLRSVPDAELSQAASLLAGEGSAYQVGANLVEGPEALTLVTLGLRWPTPAAESSPVPGCGRLQLITPWLLVTWNAPS